MEDDEKPVNNLSPVLEDYFWKQLKVQLSILQVNSTFVSEFSHHTLLAGTNFSSRPTRFRRPCSCWGSVWTWRMFCWNWFTLMTSPLSLSSQPPSSTSSPARRSSRVFRLFSSPPVSALAVSSPDSRDTILANKPLKRFRNSSFEVIYLTWNSSSSIISLSCKMDEMLAR